MSTKKLLEKSGAKTKEYSLNYINPAGDTMSGALTLAGDPTSALHAAPKQYVDATAQGLKGKDSVKAATTENIVLNDEQTIDGINLVDGNRVLVKNQSGTAEISTVDFTGKTGSDLAGKYFFINSPSTAYYVWFNTGSDSDPLQTGTPIEVNIGSGDSASVLAGKLQTVLDVMTTVFDATVETNVVTITNVSVGAVTDINSGNSGLSVAVVTQGKNVGWSNGIYIVKAGLDWVRATDANSWSKLISAYVFVEEGNTHADSGWLCTVDAEGTLGTTSITWTQFSQAGIVTASNVNTAGTGVFKQKTGSNLEFRGIKAASSKVDVTLDAPTNEIRIDVIQSNLDHGSIGGLGDDDHTQYVHISSNRTITAQHIFAPTEAQAPFALGTNAQGQLVTGLNADKLDGQDGSYYTNASNLNAGTLPASCFDDTAHGSRSGGSLHSAATTSANGFMSSTDKTKLDGILVLSKTLPAYENLTAGDLVYAINDNGTMKWAKADADAYASKADAFVLTSKSSGQDVAGYFTGINNQLSSLTPGALYYLSTTAGGIVTEANLPSGTGDIIQLVGKALSDTELLFTPEVNPVELV